MTDPGHPKYSGVSKKKGLLPDEIETVANYVLEQVRNLLVCPETDV